MLGVEWYPWYLKSQTKEWVGNTLHLAIETDVECHLWCFLTTSYPYRRDRWVIFRSVPRRHRVHMMFNLRQAIEQNEPGETLVHTFDVPDWRHCRVRYWYYAGKRKALISWSTSCIFWAHYAEKPMPPGPVPTPDPIEFETADSIMRCGNRYTFWANNTWYVFSPTTTTLEMWKLVDGVFQRMDILHEPSPVLGLYRDADARLEVNERLTHVAAFERLPSGTVHNLWHVRFDHMWDRWEWPTLVFQPKRTAFSAYGCSILVDEGNRPSIFFNHHIGTYPEIWHTRYIEGHWRAPEQAIKVGYQVCQYPSAYYDEFDQSQHIISVTNVRGHWHRSWRPPDHWGVQTALPSLGVNSPQHSVAANAGYVDVAQVTPTWWINAYRDGVAWEVYPQLTQPMSTYANFILNYGPSFRAMIVFHDDDGHLAYVDRSEDLDWSPEVQLPYAQIQILTAHYAWPDVVACAWIKDGWNKIVFYAFPTGWDSGIPP